MRLSSLRLGVGTFATWLAVSGVPPGVVGAEGAPPNILIIVTDDQRPGTLGVMPKTRRWLGTNGTRYPNAFITTPLCCPSRATIFSGRYAHNHGVTTNRNGHAELLDQRFTVQRYLHDAGYRTGIFGKYLNGWNLTNDPPHFDDWAIFSRGYPSGYSGATWNVGGVVKTVNPYSTTFIKRRAVRFLRAAEEGDARPWLLFLNVWAPHTPTKPQRKYRGAPVGPWSGNPSFWEEDRSDKPPLVQEQSTSLGAARSLRRGQLRTLLSVDDLVDGLFRELGALGERRNTLVFFLSDNGHLWGDHGLLGKRLPYTRSVKIPLLVRWPNAVPAVKRDERLVANVDIAPTIMHLAGAIPEPDHPMDGRSLLDPAIRDRVLLEYWHTGGWFVPSWASLRTENLQYVEYYDEAGSVTFREYYDLVNDPWQLENLLGDGDPDNDPGPGEWAALSLQLRRDGRCEGVEGPSACP